MLGLEGGHSTSLDNKAYSTLRSEKRTKFFGAKNAEGSAKSTRTQPKTGAQFHPQEGLRGPSPIQYILIKPSMMIRSLMFALVLNQMNHCDEIPFN